VKNVTISDELAALRDRLTGCEVVAFADLSTGMVLASNTVEKLGQEKLDALCAEGSRALMGPAARALSDASGLADDCSLSMAMCGHAGSISCFVRAPQPAQEALCFVFQPDAALQEVSSAASEVLARIASES